MKQLSPPFLIALLAFTACQARAPASESANPVEQWSGQWGGPAAAATRVVRSAEEWNGFWEDVSRTPPRPLNTSTEMAVAVFMGGRRTGGYSVAIIQGGEEPDAFTVWYREKAPDPEMRVAQSLTSPWTIAVFPRSERPVVVRQRAERPSEK